MWSFCWTRIQDQLNNTPKSRILCHLGVMLSDIIQVLICVLFRVICDIIHACHYHNQIRLCGDGSETESMLGSNVEPVLPPILLFVHQMTRRESSTKAVVRRRSSSEPKSFCATVAWSGSGQYLWRSSSYSGQLWRICSTVWESVVQEHKSVSPTLNLWNRWYCSLLWPVLNLKIMTCSFLFSLW